MVFVDLGCKIIIVFCFLSNVIIINEEVSDVMFVDFFFNIVDK